MILFIAVIFLLAGGLFHLRRKHESKEATGLREYTYWLFLDTAAVGLFGLGTVFLGLYALALLA